VIVGALREENKALCDAASPGYVRKERLGELMRADRRRPLNLTGPANER
jgi:hypothetical protein